MIGSGDTGTLPLVAIDIDGGTDIGAALSTSDLIIVDDGGTVGQTEKDFSLSRLVTLTDDSATALAIGWDKYKRKIEMANTFKLVTKAGVTSADVIYTVRGSTTTVVLGIMLVIQRQVKSQQQLR